MPTFKPSRGRLIAIDKKTGRPMAKPARMSTSAKIAKRKRPKQTWRKAT